MSKLKAFALGFFFTILLFSPLLTLPLSVPEKPHRSTITLRSWTSYSDDSHSQGFYEVGVYENTTGSWVLNHTLNYADSGCAIPYGSGVQLKVWVTANQTLLGFAAGTYQNFLKVNVSVTFDNGTAIWSQQNGTWSDYGVLSGVIYKMACTFTVNMITEYWMVYNVVMHYETYW